MQRKRQARPAPPSVQPQAPQPIEGAAPPPPQVAPPTAAPPIVGNSGKPQVGKYQVYGSDAKPWWYDEYGLADGKDYAEVDSIIQNFQVKNPHLNLQYDPLSGRKLQPGESTPDFDATPYNPNGKTGVPADAVPSGIPGVWQTSSGHLITADGQYWNGTSNDLANFASATGIKRLPYMPRTTTGFGGGELDPEYVAPDPSLAADWSTRNPIPGRSPRWSAGGFDASGLAAREPGAGAPSAPPANGGWYPGMNPFSPQAQAAAQNPRPTQGAFDPMTGTRSPAGVQNFSGNTANARTAQPFSTSVSSPWDIIKAKANGPTPAPATTPYPTGERYGVPTPPSYQRSAPSGSGSQFDIGQFIEGLLRSQSGSPTFNPSGRSASSFTAPGYGSAIEAPEFDFNAPRTDAATEELLMDMLANPSAYDDEVIKMTFDRLAGSIDDQYDQENVRIHEDMARRGLQDSTVYGGRLQDSNVMRRSAKTDLGERIIDTAARTRGADRAAALQAGMAFGDQQFSRQATEFQAAMQTAGFNSNEAQRIFDDALRSAQFGREGEQIDYEQALSTFMANLNSRNINTNQLLQIVQSFLQYAQQAFENQMTTARFNRDEDWRNQDIDLSLLGL